MFLGGFFWAVFIPREASGQGTVVFNNSESGIIQQWTTQGYQPMPRGGVVLVYAPLGTSYVPYERYTSLSVFLALNPGWLLSAPTRITEPGRFNAGVVELGELGFPVPPGSSIQYVIGAWTEGFGTWDTFDAAFFANEWVEVSPMYTSGTGVDASTAVPIADTFRGLLVPIPEPSSAGIVSLGLALWAWWNRRRKTFRRDL